MKEVYNETVLKSLEQVYMYKSIKITFFENLNKILNFYEFGKQKVVKIYLFPENFLLSSDSAKDIFLRNHFMNLTNSRKHTKKKVKVHVS